MQNCKDEMCLLYYLESSTGMKGNTSTDDDSVLEDLVEEYACVICANTTPSSEDRPVGMVVLLQVNTYL